MTLKGFDAARFNLLMKWPDEAKSRGLRDPFAAIYQQTLFVDDENGVVRSQPNPNAPPMPTHAEKAAYALERDKWVSSELAAMGYWSELRRMVIASWDENKEILENYIQEIVPCIGEMCQCNMFCKYFVEGACKKYDYRESYKKSRFDGQTVNSQTFERQV